MEIASDGVCRLNIMYPDTSFLISFSDKLGHYLRLKRSILQRDSFHPDFLSVDIRPSPSAGRSARPLRHSSTSRRYLFFGESREERKGPGDKKKIRNSQTLSWGRIKDGPDLLYRKVGRVGRTPCVVCHCLGVFVLPDSRGK